MNWTSEEKCWTPKRCAVPSSNWSCDSCGMPHQGSIQGPSVNPDMNKLPLALESFAVAESDFFCQDVLLLLTA